MRAHAHPNPSGVAGNRQSAAACALLDDLGQGKIHPAEIQGGLEVFVDTKHEHVSVVGLDLAGLQDQQAELILQGPVVRLGVEEAVLGEHEPVQGKPLAPDPLAVVLNLGATVVRDDGVAVQIEDHAGMKRGTPKPLSVATKSAFTAMPMARASRSQSTRLVISRGPSSRST